MVDRAGNGAEIRDTMKRTLHVADRQADVVDALAGSSSSVFLRVEPAPRTETVLLDSTQRDVQ